MNGVEFMHLLKHRWSKWEQYDWHGFTYGSLLDLKNTPKQISQRRQKRHCELCDKEQDELVRNG